MMLRMGAFEQASFSVSPAEVTEKTTELIPLEKIRHVIDRVQVKNTAGETVQIIPIEERYPEKDLLVSSLPVLVAPGFTVGPKTLGPNLEYLAREGLHVLTYDAPQGVLEESESFLRLQRSHEFNIDIHEQRKTAALLEVIRQKGFEKIDAIGHSEGAIYLVLAALEQPEWFRTLLLENPGGMVGEDSFFALIGRAYAHRRQEIEAIEKDDMVRNMLSIGKGERRQNLTNDILRGAASPRAIACTQIQELLFLLKKKGVHIIIAHAVDDLIFPMDKVQEISRSMKDEGGNSIPGREFIDGFYSIQGGHNDFIVNPRMHAILAMDAFTAITKKETRRPLLHQTEQMVA